LIAACRPSWANLERVCRIVLRAIFNASIIWVSLFPLSASNSIRQRVIFLAFSVPLFVSSFNNSCSFGLNLTYIFCPSHALQIDIPLENILAIYEEATGKKFM